MKILFLLCFFLTAKLAALSEFKTLSQLSDVLPHVEKETLVLFDIDDVLIGPHASWLWEDEFLKHKMKFDETLASSLQKLRFPMQYQLIDPTIERIFSSIRKKEAKISAITSRMCDEDSLSFFLKKKGLYFDDSFSKSSGILFCNNQPKGQCLFQVLQNHPKAIIFIDDKRENLESVLTVSQSKYVPCKVFLYNGAQKLFNWDIAEYQFRQWKKNGIILSDKKARKLLKDSFISQKRKSSLLYNLQTQSLPNLPSDSMGKQLWQVHREWILPLKEFLEQHTNGDPHPEDKDHFLYRFDRNDARIILKPILQNSLQFQLTDDLIDQIFFERIRLNIDNHRTSEIEYFQKESIKEETLKIAKIAHEHAKANVVVILGQTPAYIGEMLKVLEGKRSLGTQVINIPFSGRPNLTKKPKYKNLWSTAYLDIVTKKGEMRFFKLLKKQGLCPKTQKEIFIIDNSTGTSITCFVAMLNKYFSHFQMKLPKITFLHMGKESDFSTIDENGNWVPSKSFDFSYNDYLSFDIPVRFLGMDDEIAKAFDSIYDNLRIVPSYNGLYWSKKYLKQELSEYPRFQAKQLIGEYRKYAKKN